jgi:hypothetical protein
MYTILLIQDFYDDQEFKIIQGRAVGRPVVWSNNEASCVCILYEGADNLYYVQEIHSLTDPLRTRYHFSIHKTIESAIREIALDNDNIEDTIKRLL